MVPVAAGVGEIVWRRRRARKGRPRKPEGPPSRNSSKTKYSWLMYTKLSRCLGAIVLLGGGRVAMGQDPVRLPGVIVKAPIEKPGPRALAGAARDTFAIGIDSVEISIPELKLRAFTDGG